MAASPGEATALPAALSGLRTVLAVIFVVAVPLFLISTNVRWFFEDRAVYTSGFAKYHVSERTGLSPVQLEGVADAFIAYFRGPRGRMDVQVERQGRVVPLFNERELIHMEDVQALVQGFYRVQLVAGLALVLTAIAGFALWRQSFLSTLGWWALWGAGVTLALPLLVGLLAVMDFQSLALRFHLVSFRNDFWMLDPSRDYLIMLFPYPGFWLDVTLRFAAATAAEALLLAAAGFGLLRLR